MRFMLIGDLGTPHTTGSHLLKAIEANGHEACGINERPEIWGGLNIDLAFDVVVWNSTPGYAPPETYPEQLDFLHKCEDYGIPTVGYHLDLYFSLPEREHWVAERPFFRSKLLCTADGGHDELWADHSIDHVWFPPAVLASDCTPGVFREEYAADIAFVGSWTGYHERSKHRFELVKWLRATYGARARFFPPRREPRIVGQDLNDLYASVKVVVGDSCMVPHLKRYWSDRIPETTGRGAYLLHPKVQGLTPQHEQIHTWNAGDWEKLDVMIGHALAHDGWRQSCAFAARNETLAKHTYERRIEQLVATLTEKGMI